MPYPKCKIYSDRSHYIAIPHTERPYKPRRKVQEEEIVVEEPQEQEEQESATPQADIDTEEQIHEEQKSEEKEQAVPEMSHTSPKITTTERRMTRKQLFEQLYAEGRGLKKRALKSMLIKGMKPYFPNEQAAREYVDRNLRRKQRNLVARRIRMSRKANLQTFNFFVTVTYFYGQFLLMKHKDLPTKFLSIQGRGCALGFLRFFPDRCHFIFVPFSWLHVL